MLISKNPYEKIETCDLCSGYKSLNPDDVWHSHEVCPKCKGTGVYIEEEQGRVVLDNPIFVDFKTRNNILIYKVILILVLLLVLGLSLYFIVNGGS